MKKYMYKCTIYSNRSKWNQIIYIFLYIYWKERTDLMKNTIKQGFLDVSFKYIPPGMSSYKILALSGFDIEVKKEYYYV